MKHSSDMKHLAQALSLLDPASVPNEYKAKAKQYLDTIDIFISLGRDEPEMVELRAVLAQMIDPAPVISTSYH